MSQEKTERDKKETKKQSEKRQKLTDRNRQAEKKAGNAKRQLLTKDRVETKIDEKRSRQREQQQQQCLNLAVWNCMQMSICLMIWSTFASLKEDASVLSVYPPNRNQLQFWEIWFLYWSLAKMHVERKRKKNILESLSAEKDNEERTLVEND